MTEEKEPYYKIIEFLDYQNSLGLISDSDLLEFKKTIRDNKYVATYIRSLKSHLHDETILKYSDYKFAMQKHDKSKNSIDLVPWIIRNLFLYKTEDELSDPVQVIRNLIQEALEREGAICDIRDSVQSQYKFGICENENHDELWREKNYTQNDWNKWNELSDHKFPSKEMPVPKTYEKLYITLYGKDEISKYDDSHAIYVCKMCVNDLYECGDGPEVSCDLD